MLKINKLTAVIEDKTVLNNINLEVQPGELHVVLGPNGAGKSTLGKVLLGDDRYNVVSGNIKFREKSMLEMPTHKRAQEGFFLSFQTPPEIEGVTARELLFAARKTIDPDLISSFRFKKTFTKNLEKVHLGKEFTDRNMNDGASGGERKKMELASLLTLDPKLIFLDEIDSGIDVDAMNVLTKTINEFMENPAKSAIIISHTDNFLNKLHPTNVHILCDGKIIHSGGVELIKDVHECGFCPYMKNCTSK